jgi:hypothetical protein
MRAGRIILLAVLTAILGVAGGTGTALLRLHVAPWDGDPEGTADPRAPELPLTGGPLPKVVVDQERYEFGKMDINGKGEHDFIVSNRGQGALELSSGDTSCRCAGSKIEKKTLLPGESTKVTVRYTTKGAAGAYLESATILTNDPDRPRLTLSVKGRVVVAVRPAPAELVFSRVAAGESALAEVPLYGYLEEPLKIVGVSLSDQATAGYFEVTFLPLPPDQLEEEADARSGCLVRVEVKPGLPLGPFQQKILARTNLESAPTVEIPVTGTVVCDISIVGEGWNDETGVLTLGTVSSRAGARRRLMLLVRGPHRKEVMFNHVETFPGLLDVKLGKPIEINDGAVIMTPLIVGITKGSPPANHLGSDQGRLGQILIVTNHPKTPELHILVSFAVKG